VKKEKSVKKKCSTKQLKKKFISSFFSSTEFVPSGAARLGRQMVKRTEDA